EDVPVQVHVVRHGGPLVRAEGRELPGLVRRLGERDVLLPDRAGNLGRRERFDGRATHEHVDRVQEDSRPLGIRVRLEHERLRRGSLLIGELGSFASRVTPTYSEWSVTPAKSSGVSIFTMKPSGCLIGSPLKYLYASPGPVTLFPPSHA